MEISSALHVSDLSHSYISARRYAISGPLLWYIGPTASNVSGLIEVDRMIKFVIANNSHCHC